MKKITFLLLTFVITSLSWAQCPPGAGGQYPAATIAVDADGAITPISGCNYSSEFSLIDGVVSGNDYMVTITLDDADLYVTVENSADNSLIAHGASPFTFTAPAGVTGLQLNWSEDAACTYVEIGCRTTTIQDLTAAANVCLDPEDFEASNIMDVSADLSWAEGGVSTVDYNVEVYLAGESAADANTPVFANANVVGTTVTATGLSESVDYDAYISANCSGSTATSELIGPESFTTTSSCSDVTDVDIEMLRSTSVDVTFTPGTGNDSMLVEVYIEGESAADGDTPVYTNAGVTSSPESVTGLTATTAYDIYVTGFCGGTASALVGPISFMTPITGPANDECVDAETLTVNADYECAETTSGTIAGATASGESEAACFGTENDDVWFSFVATAEAHSIDLLNIEGGTTDLYHSVWSGACGTLTNLSCSDPNSSSVEGLTIGDTYLLRVNSWTSASGQTSTFDVCIGTQPTNTVDFCNLQFPNSGDISQGEDHDVYAQVFEAGVTEGEGQGDGIEAWIGYNTTDATTTADFEDDWTWISADYNNDNGNNDEYFAEIGSGLDPGTYYYVSRFSVDDGPFTYGGINPGSSDGNFWDGTDYVSGELIVSPPPVPANDLFADAISVACGDAVMGTTLGATQDEDDAPDTNADETDTFADNDSPWVWYSYTGSGDSETITLSTCGVENTDYDTELFVYTGTSGALTLINDGYDECGGSGENYAAEMSFTSDGTTTYYIAVGGYNVASVGNFQLSIDCETLSINDVENPAAFTYHPNPVKNTLTLNAQNTIEQVAMYNMLGQEVLRATPNAVDSDLDLSSLQTGTYFVKVTIGSVTETIRVIKQ